MQRRNRFLFLSQAINLMPVAHYENFPVASLLLPARLREPVQAIYAFARTADDIADEGDALPAERIAALDEYGRLLDAMVQPDALLPPLFATLKAAVSHWRLPLAPFHDLLSAFRQDVVTTRYATAEALLDYCSRSANPVGRLMLHLYGMTSMTNSVQSDAICSALQLTNFLQDVAIDLAKGRIYLPQADLARFGVAADGLASAVGSTAWSELMGFQVAHARRLMQSGAPLATRLPGRIGWELRLVVQGGLRILQRIESADYDVFHHRPVLGPLDWLAIGWSALWMKPTASSR